MILDSRFYSNFYKYKRKFQTLIKFSTSASASNNAGKVKVLFFGTDSFSLPSLQILNKSRKANSVVTDLGVVTSFKSPTNQVKLYASKENLPLLRWPVRPEDCRPYDLGVVVSFGHLIPNNIIEAFSLGMINVHASLLPRWRGAAPIIYSIMKGEKKTGVTIMRIAPKHFDVGDILAQQEVVIPPHSLMPQLHDVLAIKGAELLLRTVEQAPASLQKSQKQSNEAVTYAPKIKPSVAEVRWTEMTALEVYNLYRGLYSYKALTTTFGDQPVKIIELRYDAESQVLDPSGSPGEASYAKRRKSISVCCKDGHSVEILQLRVEGKKVMSAIEFNNGFLKKASSPGCFK